MYTDYHTFKLELEQQVAVLAFASTQRFTSLEHLQELEAAFQELELSSEVRSVILTGEGEQFLAGWQMANLQKLDLPGVRDFMDYLREVLARIENCGKPVIAAVNGMASGFGMELALSAHVLLASETAQFSLTEASLGCLPLGGGLQRLLRQVGRGRALEIVLGSYPLTAQDAYEWGLINHVFPAEVLLERAREMALLFQSQAPLAVQQALRSILQGDNLSLRDALLLESNLNLVCWGSGDFQEGIQASLEQRKAIFRGH